MGWISSWRKSCRIVGTGMICGIGDWVRGDGFVGLEAGMLRWSAVFATGGSCRSQYLAVLKGLSNYVSPGLMAYGSPRSRRLGLFSGISIGVSDFFWLSGSLWRLASCRELHGCCDCMLDSIMTIRKDWLFYTHVEVRYIWALGKGARAPCQRGIA